MDEYGELCNSLNKKYTVLDLFSGAGGLTEGFSTDKFQFLAHVEMNPNAARTLETRLGYHLLHGTRFVDIYYSYLRNEISRDEYINRIRDLNLFDDNLFVEQISDSSIGELFSRIDETKKRIGIDKVDVVIGGPPCQAYSRIGRARDPHSMINDPRNYLYLHYLAFLERYKPDFFVFENVPGIKSAQKGKFFEDLINGADRQGYSVYYDLLNAADFGVLQERKRLIIMGWKKKHDFEYPVFAKDQKEASVRDLLCDLPALQPGGGTDLAQEYLSPPSKYLKETGLRSEKDILRNHWARGHNERDRKIYRQAIQELKDGRRLRYDRLPEELRTHKNMTSFLDRFKVVNPDTNSHSVVAHISKDGHYYIHPDINQARSLTVREVARIQSFPDNYLFEGSRCEQFKQVGNAVPPLMAKGIADKVHRILKRI